MLLIDVHAWQNAPIRHHIQCLTITRLMLYAASGGCELHVQEAGESQLFGAIDDVCAQSSAVAPASTFPSQLHDQSQHLVSSPSIEQFQQSLQTLLLPRLAHVQ